jgi:FkbM family methyltransferase
VLYGRGNLGKLAKEYCKTVGQPVLGTLEHAEPHSSMWNKSPVAVCVVNHPYVPIERHLLGDSGFEKVVPFYDFTEKFRGIHPLSNGWYLGDISPNVNLVLTRWADDTSRAHHLQFLAWRRIREEWSFRDAPVTINDRYFIPEVLDCLNEKEVFLDVGAHHGEVSNHFAEITNWKFKQVILIEPDPYNYKALAAKVRIHDAMAFREFVSDTHEERTFHYGLGYSSQLSDTGTFKVWTETIDSMSIEPTFIKLHLEGHELPALKGAIRTLIEKRPIVAATVYHNADGVWKTPMWLMDNLPKYKFLFRLHGWCGTGAVVYAIPKERV